MKNLWKRIFGKSKLEKMDDKLWHMREYLIDKVDAFVTQRIAPPINDHEDKINRLIADVEKLKAAMEGKL